MLAQNSRLTRRDDRMMAMDLEVNRNFIYPKRPNGAFILQNLRHCVKMDFWSSSKKAKKSMMGGSAKRSHRPTTNASSPIQEPSQKKPKSVASDRDTYSSPLLLKMAPIDIDSDTEPPQTLQVLDWRMDPEDSFADWTMGLSTKEDTDHVRKYHVHRSMLMVASPMFRELFGRHGHRAPSSRFVLPKTAMDAFEGFLDFVYQLKRVEFSTGNAIALYYLGRAFGVERLRWEAKQFWQDDISFATIATYYEDAIELEEEGLATAVMDACAKDSILQRLTKESDILNVADVRLMMFLVEKKGEEHSMRLSSIVSEFCSLHGIDYTHHCFAQLTLKLPKISFEAAKTFLALEDPEVGHEMTILQERCAAAIAENWQKLDVCSDAWTESLNIHSPTLLVKILQRALLAAQTQSKTTSESPSASLSEQSKPEFIQCGPNEDVVDLLSVNSRDKEQKMPSAPVY